MTIALKHKKGDIGKSLTFAMDEVVVENGIERVAKLMDDSADRPIVAVDAASAA